MLLATAIRPEVNKVDDRRGLLLASLARRQRGQQFPFHSGNADLKYAWNLGERMGMSRASLLPLAAFCVDDRVVHIDDRQE